MATHPDPFIQSLFTGYLNHSLSRQQLYEFDQLTKELTRDEIALYMIAQFEVMPERELLGAQSDELLHMILEAKELQIPVHRVHFMRSWRAIAAAVIIFIIAGISTLYFINKQETLPVTAQTQAQRFHNDIQPGKAGALLKLENGTVIDLDKVANGAVVDGVVKADATVTAGASANAKIEYATLSTPVGRTMSLKLPDSSVIWLDALSSVTFPSRFIPGKKREIRTTGQVFLEVHHDDDTANRFVTHTKGEDVTVLGTHFNVNGYGSNVVTTLLEGKVHIGNKSLKPSEQYIKGTIKTVDTDQVVAWKEGKFKFDGASMQEITSQLSRWYDMEVEYVDNVKGEYVASNIPRNLPLSEVLKALELTGRVKFVIDGRKVLVYR